MTPETTDITLFVRTSSEEIAGWNRRRIVDALMRETDVDEETAEAISREVEKQIMASGIGTLTTPLIREMVDAKLVERGLETAGRMHTRIGFPLYDARQLILHRNRENANVPHGPEGTNLILAEGIKRAFALNDVFSQDIGNAHASGDIHLHGLGFIDRPYSACQSLEYLKKYGMNLPHALTAAGPARHVEVLLAHMVRFGAALQAHFAGTIGWDAVNVSFAPYLENMPDRDIRQVAQMLVYEFSQLTSARGGQAMFTDIHLWWEVPEWLARAPAIGPGGKPTGRVYGDYRPDAQRFARALFESLQEGDATGKPFIFPRPVVHITETFFETPGHEAFLDLICAVAGEKGNTCFSFDRNGSPSRLSGLDPKSAAEAEEPESMRSFTLHNVTVNLPRLGYRAKKDDRRLFQLLADGLDLAVRAHVQKKDFLERLLSQGDQGPLSLLTMNRDGQPFLRMDRSVFMIGMAGLNELVRIHTGSPLHASEEALSFGLKVIAYMRQETLRLGEMCGLKIILGQSHAETTAHRFARLDLKYHSPDAGRYVRGRLAGGEIYYTNSTHLEVSASVDPLTRIEKEGRFHSLIEADAMTHLWLGAENPSKGKLADLVVRTFKETRSRQIAFSPEFTICAQCNRTSRGLKKVCDLCGSEDVDGMARITQYYSRISDWNKGKLAELAERNRNEDRFR